MDGHVPAGLLEIRENSAQTVEVQNLLKMDIGPVPAELKIKGNSVWNVAAKNRRMRFSIDVINVDGSRKIKQNHQNSARNVEIHLIMQIS